LIHEKEQKSIRKDYNNKRTNIGQLNKSIDDITPLKDKSNLKNSKDHESGGKTIKIENTGANQIVEYSQSNGGIKDRPTTRDKSIKVTK